MEDFLRERKKILGDIPIVIALTKLDLLDSALLPALRSEGAVFKTMEDAKPLLEPRRVKFLDQYCTQPLLRAAEGDIPHVAVSTKSGYSLEPTISELVKITTSEIERYIKADPSYSSVTERPSIERDAPYYIAGMAQRASIEAKVDLTIAVAPGYWRNLSACLRFSGEKVKDYLLVIHQDIIQVWNFNDPEMALRGDDFKAALLNTSNLGVSEIRDAQAVLATVTPLVSALAPLINELVGIAIALPIAGAVILTQLLREVYKSSQTIVKCFMAYITDLIYVMKILFVLAPQGSITSQDVALALKVYETSTYRNRIHLEIRDFSTTFTVLPGGRDVVVDKIEALIRRHSITDEEVSRLRSQIKPAALSSS
ncbi:hypothetical protein J3R83DRAFT_11528 [Lanmaoa asiatica]|nr:hypothetical protein J3R83DRAFT_11528 [Lanmaoa asiatica]